MSVLSVANLHFNSTGSERIELIDGNVKVTTTGNFIVNGKEPGATVIISNTSPSSPDAGDMWWNSNTAELLIYYTDNDSSQWVTASPGTPGPQGPDGPIGPTGPAGPYSPKSLTISYPVANDQFTLIYTPIALTVANVITTTLSGNIAWANSSVTANLYYGTDRSSGTLILQNFVTGNTKVANSNTNFSSASIPANNFIWLQLRTVVNTPLEYHMTMVFQSS